MRHDGAGGPGAEARWRRFEDAVPRGRDYAIELRQRAQEVDACMDELVTNIAQAVQAQEARA